MLETRLLIMPSSAQRKCPVHSPCTTMVFGGEGPCSNTLLICRGRLSALALCGSDDLYWVSASVDLIVGML